MGITIVPGPSVGINNAINSIAGSIDKMLNPNKDLNIAMQRAMASNPELITHMADMEARAPGTYERLGLSHDLAGVLRTVPMSTAGRVDEALAPGAAGTAVAQQGAARATADATSKVAPGAADNAVGQQKLTGDIIQKAGKIMAADPSITFDAALKTMGLGTKSERNVEKAQEPVKMLELAVAKSTLQRAGALPKDLATMNWAQTAREFIDGKGPGATVGASLFTNVDTREAFTEVIAAIKQERQLAGAIAQASFSGDNTYENMKHRQAWAAFADSQHVGTAKIWEDVLFDPAVQERSRELVADPTLAKTQEDKDLLAVARVRKVEVDTAKLSPILKVGKEVGDAMKAADVLDNGTPEQAQAIIRINAALQKRAELGGPKHTAYYDDNGIWRGKIKYKDEEGKEISGEMINAIISDPNAADITMPDGNLSPAAQGAIGIITKSKNDKVAELATFRLQDKSPGRADSKAVEAALIRSGVIPKTGAVTTPTPASNDSTDIVEVKRAHAARVAAEADPELDAMLKEASKPTVDPTASEMGPVVKPTAPTTTTPTAVASPVIPSAPGTIWKPETENPFNKIEKPVVLATVTTTVPAPVKGAIFQPGENPFNKLATPTAPPPPANRPNAVGPYQKNIATAITPVAMTEAPPLDPAVGASKGNVLSPSPAILATVATRKVPPVVESMLAHADTMLGIKYQWGGASKATGYDCSGFVREIFAKEHITLPRTTSEMIHSGSPVDFKDMQPGDLIFFDADKNDRVVDHVVMYAGQNQVVQSSSSGGGIRYDDLGSPRGKNLLSHLLSVRRVIK